MPADPSLSSLPPEMVEALRGRLARFGVSDPEVMANGLADEITPLLAERWEGLKEACRREMAHHFALPDAGLAAERDAAQAVARRLREALEEIDALPDSRPRGSGKDRCVELVVVREAKRIARAALSASPVPEARTGAERWPTEEARRAYAAGRHARTQRREPVEGPFTADHLYDAWHDGWARMDEQIKAHAVPPVSVPEQEEGPATILVSTLRQKLDEMELHDDLPDSHDIGFMACWRELRDWLDSADEPVAASSSSSEEGERAAACSRCGGGGYARVHSHQDYGISFESEICEICDYGQALMRIDSLEEELRDAAAALRERLTCDEAVGVADAGWRSATVPALEAARVELRERGHAECIRREQLRGALSALADFLLNDREEGR